MDIILSSITSMLNVTFALARVKDDVILGKDQEADLHSRNGSLIVQDFGGVERERFVRARWSHGFETCGSISIRPMSCGDYLIRW